MHYVVNPCALGESSHPLYLVILHFSYCLLYGSDVYVV